MDPERWERVKRIYSSALECGPDEQESFLNEACGGDDSLRKEVETLLAQQRKADGFMKAPAMEVAAHVMAKDQGKAIAESLAGQSVAHYSIIEKIGEGGMGVVYLAKDTRLDRHVAIKSLPDIFAADPVRMARFEREAKILATLNHPNIASIYGLEESDGKRFLVMELVEGKTLAEQLKKGRIPLDETLEICRQIAVGLEAAHEKGIIHRDLKPSNIKLTPEGKATILDFGLAKALFRQPASESEVAVVSESMTETGVILGTAACMSPEQAKGKPVDKRADIWAFGCILYECLTGRRPFPGESVSDTIASIIAREPDWMLLPTETPAIVRSVLRRCLQKDPERRLHDIADARVELGEEVAEPSIPARRLSFGWLIAASLAILAVGVLIGFAVMKYSKSTASPISQPVVRTKISLEAGYWLTGMRDRPPNGFDQPTRTAMAISSDGRFIVYSAIKENPTLQDKPRLFLRKLDQMEAKPISGTEGGVSPFLSPDDRWIGFWADSKLMKVPVDGGVPTQLCDAWLTFGASWGDDNQIVFAPRGVYGLSRVSANGGKPETLTSPDRSKGESGHRLPHCLPAGKGILFTIMKQSFGLDPLVAVMNLTTRKWRILLEDAADARYVGTGHMVFLRRGTLMAVPFDREKCEITGQPVPVVAGIMQALNASDTSLNTSGGQFSFSASGSMAYAPGGIMPDSESSLVWVDHKGKAEAIASFKAPFYRPRLSPDGQSIAYCTLGQKRQVWIYSINRGTATNLTSDGYAHTVMWTPDCLRLAFEWSKAGEPNIYWQSADGSPPMERLTQSEIYQGPGSWSPDGKTLAFVEGDSTISYNILILQMPERKVTPFLSSRFNEVCPEFSPDGQWIAYASNESGRGEVYVQQFSGPGGKVQISNDGGAAPLWSRNGKQLFYRRQDQVYAVDVQSGTHFSAGKPRLLFEQPGYAGNSLLRSWDISLDGQRFLMVKLEERKPRPVMELILVLNCFEELKRLCPTK